MTRTWNRSAATLGVLAVAVGIPVAVGLARSQRGARPASAGAKDGVAPAATTSATAPPGMRWVPGGRFAMGTDSPESWPEERPAHPVEVAGFWIDEAEVTVAEFGRFVAATGYVTTAEKPPTPGQAPGSLVFTPTGRPVPTDDFSQWWAWTPGTSWRHPGGPGTTTEGKEDHPVVQVSWDDAAAYAAWAGKRLPTEAEWEVAARGGLVAKTYIWGDDEPGSGGRWQANIWQGRFPERDTGDDGFTGTAPVRSFPPNGYGLYDMAGNVWEWCADEYDPAAYRRLDGHGAGPGSTGSAGERVQRGGSFLCNYGYCSRYRPSARGSSSPDTGASHVGFRCVQSPDPAR